MKKLKVMFFGADGTGGGTVEYVEMKNPMSGEPVQVPKSLEPFIGAVAAFNRRGAADKASVEIERLKAELDDAKLAAVEAGKNKGLDKQLEAMKAEHEKTMKAVADQSARFENESKSWRGKYEDTKINNDLFSVLPSSELHNPGQTMATIRALGKPRLVEKIGIDGSGTGSFETMLELDGTVIPAKDYITKFFSSDENKFHLKNKLSPGGGTTTSGTFNSNGGGGKAIPRAEFDKLDPLQKAAMVKKGASIAD